MPHSHHAHQTELGLSASLFRAFPVDLTPEVSFCLCCMKGVNLLFVAIRNKVLTRMLLQCRLGVLGCCPSNCHLLLAAVPHSPALHRLPEGEVCYGLHPCHLHALHAEPCAGVLALITSDQPCWLAEACKILVLLGCSNNGTCAACHSSAITH